MTILLSSIILSTIALILSYLIGKKNPARSSGLTAGIIILLLLLPFTFFLPKINITLSILNQPILANKGIQQAHWYTFFFSIWIAGSIVLLGRLALHYVSVHRWRRNATRCSTPVWTSRLHECCSILDMDTIPSLGLSDEISSPVVTGLVYPQILLPKNSETWEEDTINHVLLHELGHVKRRDLWVSVASYITCAIHWFNPLVWILRKQQVTQCEFACDAFVLSSGANAKRYIHAICNVAETAAHQDNVALALAMANKASLRQRVELLLNDQKPHGKSLTLIILFTTATLALAINVIKPIPALPLSTPDKSEYTEKEIDLRFNANPFPADE